MASSLNRATLIGVLGRDPETRRMQSGDAVVSFSLATSNRWRDRQSGEMKEKTTWHNIVIFSEQLAKIAESYLRKGSRVMVEGEIQHREYTDKDGNKRNVSEIVLQKFGGNLVLLDSRKDSDAHEPRQDRQERQPQGGKPFNPSDALDDDIPFAPPVL